MHGRVFSSIPDFYPVDASSTFPADPSLQTLSDLGEGL